MTEVELRRFLEKQGLTDSRAEFRKLKGGYLNTVWSVDTPNGRLVAKEFVKPLNGTLFPNLPEDEAEALRRLGDLEVAPKMVGFWLDASLLVYEFVEGKMWDGDMQGVAQLLLRKEAADPTGFRGVPLNAHAILAKVATGRYLAVTCGCFNPAKTIPNSHRYRREPCGCGIRSAPH